MRNPHPLTMLCLMFMLNIPILPSAFAAPPLPLKAVPIQVSGDVVQVVRSFPITLTAASGFQVYVWNHPSSFKAIKGTGDRKNVLNIQSAPEGTHIIEVKAMSFKYDKAKDEVIVTEDNDSISIIVGKIPGPVPPGPGPNPPDPPGPVVDPPIAGDGLRVLIIEESKERTKLPLGQQMIILSQNVRDYLNTACPLAEGSTTRRDWNIWEKDADASKEPKRWADAHARAKAGSVKAGGKLPWLLISNGKTGYEGPLPENVDKFLELVKKYQPTSSSRSDTTKKGG